MSDIILFERLDELVEDCSGAVCDWDDVLHRASLAAEPVAPRPRLQRPGRRALVFALVLASLLVILFATPAFGLLRDWIGRKDVSFGGQTAPFETQRNFADLSLGTPPGALDPRAIASETRKVQVFDVSGEKHVLYVAPTRWGGFCELFTNSFGTCQAKRPQATGKETEPGFLDSQLFNVVSGVNEIAPKSPDEVGIPYVIEAGGSFVAPRAASLSFEYEDRTSEQIPFVYVSKPIDAGFFDRAISSEHYEVGSRLVAVSVRDSSGNLIARSRVVNYDEYVAASKKQLEQSKSPQPQQQAKAPQLPPPSEPLRHASAAGVSAVAGANGIVVLDFSAASADAQALLEKGANFDCFTFTSPYHEDVPAGWGGGFEPQTSTRVAEGFPDLSTPIDGCSIYPRSGRSWPDPLHGHATLEIAFTAKAKTYFEDHAAANDLAAFVRSTQKNELRDLTGDALAKALADRFGSAATQLPSATASLAPAAIGFVLEAAGATYVERSTTGRLFSVTIEDGKIAKENVRELSWLY
jgi:hypothetical protein